MNSYAFEIPGIVMASFSLTFSALIAWLILRRFQPTSPRIHRLVWIAVLLNGVILWRVSFELPVLEPVAIHAIDDETGFEVSASATTDAGSATEDLETMSDGFYTIDSSDIASDLEKTEQGLTQTSPISMASAPSSGQGAVNWSMIAGLVWLVGLLVTLTILIRRYLIVFRMLRVARDANPTWQRELDEVALNFQIQSKIPLRVHADLGPMLIATPLGTQVVVPAAFWKQLTFTQRSAILNHEMAHLVRCDIWKSMVATALASIHWFNPLAWLALRQFNQAAEWACDQQVGRLDSPQRVGFARALLSLSTGNGSYLVGASGVASTDLASRVERLLAGDSADPPGRKVLMFGLIGLIGLLGWFNFRLVAAPQPPTSSRVGLVQDQDEDDARNKTLDLSKRIRPVDDELAKQFLALLKTPAGVVAVSNRVGILRDEMRQEASKTVIADYFSTTVRSDDFLPTLQREVNVAQKDISNIEAALAELRAKLNGKTESDLLLARFLKNENAGVVLYFSEFRGEMRPGKSQVMEKLGQFIAEDGKGQFVVRESVKDEFISQLKRFDGVEKQIGFMAKELKQWADEVVAKDELHQRVKDGLSRPDAAAVTLSRMEKNRSPREMTEQYFGFLEEILIDSAEGLVIADDQRELVSQSILASDQHRKKMELLRGPIAEIAAAIKIRGEAEQLAKDFLSSDFGLSIIVEDIDIGNSSPEAIVNRIKSEALEESDDGRLKVREDRLEQVANFSREMLIKSRRARRQTMILDEHVERIENDSLKAVCDSFAGRMILIEKIKARAESLNFEAWDRWIELVFEESDGGLAIRPDRRDEISRVIEDTKQIEQELQKDDF